MVKIKVGGIEAQSDEGVLENPRRWRDQSSPLHLSEGNRGEYCGKDCY